MPHTHLSISGEKFLINGALTYSEISGSKPAAYGLLMNARFIQGIFDDKVFVVSFASNVVIAAAIVYLGDQLGVGGQLSTGVIVVLGIRIFSNVAAIRRLLFHA